MAWSGGTYTRTNGTYSGATVWYQDYQNGQKVDPVRQDTHDQDLATGINACLAKDGSNAATGNLNLGGFKVANIGNATSDTDAVAWGQTIKYITTEAELAAYNLAGNPIYLKSSITLTGNHTISVPMTLHKGGVIVTGSNVITINGAFSAGLYTCFTTTATKVLFGGDAVREVYPQWFGAVGDGTTDDTVAVKAAIASHGRVFFPAGDYRITSTLTCSHAVLLEGASPPASSGPTPYISVLRHDFSGTFITFTGADASTYGGGGGLRNIQLFNAFGSAGTAYGTAVNVLFTSTALRATWLRIENVNFEQGSSAGTWTYCIDWDGSAAVSADALRDYWVSGCRLLCETGGTAAVRLRKTIGLHFVNNIINGAVADMTITGDATTPSGQNWIIGGGGNNLSLDYADNIHISSSLWSSITDTANTTNTTIRASKLTNHIRLNGTGFADYYKGTDLTHIHQANGSNFIFSRDNGAGDTTTGVGVAIGNHGTNEGFMLAEYSNAAASGAPYYRERFLPRNNADSGLLSSAQYSGIYYTKTAGADTCKTEVMSTGGTLTLNADGSTTISSNKLEFGSVGSNLMIRTGTGTPEGAVTAVVGSLFLRTDGGAGTTLYVKQTGTGNTGWAAK